jgi:hypothetical protein
MNTEPEQSTNIRWVVTPPKDWQTNAHPGPTRLDVGYIDPNRLLGFGLRMSSILHKQWELVNDPTKHTKLDETVAHGTQMQRGWTIEVAKQTWVNFPEDTFTRLMSRHIDPAGPEARSQIDWFAGPFSQDELVAYYNQAKAKFPKDWALTHLGGVIDGQPIYFAGERGVPALLEPGELVVPKAYTQEVLERAGTARSSDAATVEEGDVVVQMENHFHGVDISDPRERRRAVEAMARDMFDAIEREKEHRRMIR